MRKYKGIIIIALFNIFLMFNSCFGYSDADFAAANEALNDVRTHCEEQAGNNQAGAWNTGENQGANVEGVYNGEGMQQHHPGQVTVCNNDVATFPEGTQAVILSITNTDGLKTDGGYTQADVAALQNIAIAALEGGMTVAEANALVESMTDGNAHLATPEIKTDGEKQVYEDPYNGTDNVMLGVKNPEINTLSLDNLNLGEQLDGLLGLLKRIKDFILGHKLLITEKAQEPEPEQEEIEPPAEVKGKGYFFVVPHENPIKTNRNSVTASASISSPYYDVSYAIPTSEKTNSHAEATTTIFDIKTRTQYAVAGYYPVTIKGTIKWTWEEWGVVDWKGTGVKSKDGNEIKDPVYGWVSESDEESFSKDIPPYSQQSATYWDVPMSTMYPLKSGSAQAVCATGEVVGSVSLGMGEGGPSKQVQTLKGSVDVNDTSVSDSFSLGRIPQGLSYDRSNALKTAQDKFDAKVNEKEAEFKGKVNTAVSDSCKTTEIDYHYNGLDVTTYASNEVTPTVGMKKNDTSGQIPSSHPNGVYVGMGLATWTDGTTKPMVPNSVYVHTPVVDYTSASNIKEEKFINQKINPSSGVKYLQLDKKFSVTIPDEGQHINSQGYGYKNFNTGAGYDTGNKPTNWGAKKDFKFDYDMYVLYDYGNNTDVNNLTNYKLYLLKANTWLSEAANRPFEVDVTKNTQLFLIPVWTPEGETTIHTRVVAENATSDEKMARVQENANTDRGSDANYKYVAYKHTPIYIVGKIYDLQVHSSTDVDWQGKIQSSKYPNSNFVRANEFPFGNTLISAGKKSQNMNSAYQYAPKLGYTFAFNFKTKGRKSSAIQIDVKKFSFVSKENKDAKEVDLWYKPNGVTQFIKIDNSQGNLKVEPNAQYMGIQAIEKLNSGLIYPIENNVDIYTKWIPDAVPYNYSNKVAIGNFKMLTLPHNLRFVYDNFAEYVGNGLYKKTLNEIEDDAVLPSKENGQQRVIGSVGRWYAGYTLPPTTIAVEPGVNPNTNPDKILKHGYIMVSFGIKSLDIADEDGDGNADPYLLYNGPEPRYDNGEEMPGDTPEIKWPTPNPTPTSTPLRPVPLPGIPDANIPPDTVPMFESDYSAAIDRKIGIEY